MISIIVPIYNAERELDRMLRSIQKQSVTEYEVIMIDDGSKDKSADICKEIAKNDLRFRYYYQENKGVSVARNNGLKRAKGEYIAFVDADDEIDQNYLEVLMNACQHSDIAVCDTVVECNGIEMKRFTGEYDALFRDDAINLLLCRKIINSGPGGKLFKRNVIGKIIFPVMKTYEDILFNLLVFSNATTVSVTSKTQYHYIENLKGAMSGMKKIPSKDIIVASDQIMQFIKEKKEIVEPECLYATISHLFQYVLAMALGESQWDEGFIMESRLVYKKYLLDILKCTAIPQKEKLVFICFVFGWIYTNKTWIYINGMR